MFNNNYPIMGKNHTHPLYYTQRYNGYHCNGGCNGNFPSNSFSYYCNMCDFDVCLTCFQNTNSNYNQTYYSANHTHPLSYLPRNGYHCNGGCNGNFPPGACSYYCNMCDFDLCPNCYNRIACNSGPQNNVFMNNHPHPLKYVPRNGFRCNLCGQNYPEGIFSYYCNMCDFDVCQCCYNRPRFY